MTRIVWNVRSFSTPMKSEVRGRFLEPNFPLISFIIAKTDVCLDENEVCFNERELRKIDSSMTNTSKFCIYFIFNFVFYLAPYSSTSMMNMFWSFFVTSLSKPGIPDYVLRVYNSKFFLLPWQSFLPTLHNLQLMQQVRFKVAFVTHFLSLPFFYQTFSLSLWSTFLSFSVSCMACARKVLPFLVSCFLLWTGVRSYLPTGKR